MILGNFCSLAERIIRLNGSISKLNDYEDVSEKVICKLSALTDIFAFFEYTDDKVNFRKKTISGLYFIIDDLEELKK